MPTDSRNDDHTATLAPCPSQGPLACHTICITEDGKCYTFGRNEAGQLGHGDKMNRGAPTLVKVLENVRITKAVAGKTHTLFLTSGGELWACGSNKFGELGLGKTCDSEDKPKQITSLGTKVVDIGAGEEFSVIATDDGSVYTFGHPEFGTLGHGTDGKYIVAAGREGFREESTPKKIVQWHQSDIKGKDYLGNIVEPYTCQKSPSQHEEWTTPDTNNGGTMCSPTIKRIYCGKKHTLALDDDGGIWSWGCNGYGRLGLNDPHDRKRPCKIDFFSVRAVFLLFCSVARGPACMRVQKTRAAKSCCRSDVGAVMLRRREKVGDA